MDLVSVIVPIYKVEKYLDRCIQSIAEQSYTNLEIILVDDGSPDGCPAICDSWAEKDSRIKVIHKENGGLSDARNAGLEIATGKYIAFIDSDDSISTEFILKLYHAIEEHHADVAECAVSYVDENGNLLRARDSSSITEMEKTEALRRLVLEDGIYQTVWNKLYRRELVIDIPFAVGKYHEDEFWTYQVLDRIEKLAVVHDALYNYLRRSTSIIGVGYNIRRLDGLEARFQRMKHLQKYEELADLTRDRLIFDCLWHYQSTSKFLQGEEKEKALSYIKSIVSEIGKVRNSNNGMKFTHRLWRAMFLAMPNLTVWIRNKIGIGI